MKLTFDTTINNSYSHTGNTFAFCGLENENEVSPFEYLYEVKNPTHAVYPRILPDRNGVQFLWTSQGVNFEEARAQEASIVVECLQSEFPIRDVTLIVQTSEQVQNINLTEILDYKVEDTSVTSPVNNLRRSFRANLRDVVTQENSKDVRDVELRVIFHTDIPTTAESDIMKQVQLGAFFVTTAKNYKNQRVYFESHEFMREGDDIKTSEFAD